jgi:hypothetical protein
MHAAVGRDVLEVQIVPHLHELAAISNSAELRKVRAIVGIGSDPTSEL